jgi:hypothetical protein
MSLALQIVGWIFVLIIVYMVVSSRYDFNTILGTFGKAVTHTTLTLQGN